MTDKKQKKVMKWTAIGLIVVFVGGIIAASIGYFWMPKTATVNADGTPSNLVVVDQIEELEKTITSLKEQYKGDEENSEFLMQISSDYVDLGYAYRSKDNEEKAVESFNTAIDYLLTLEKVNPSMAANTLYILAGAYQEAGRTEEAEATYQKVFANETDNPLPYLMYGEFVYKQGDTAKANEYFDKALGMTTSDDQKTYYQKWIDSIKGTTAAN